MTRDPSDVDRPESPRDGSQQAVGASRASLRTWRARMLRRFMALTFLSTLIPGLGLLWTRRRRVGILLLFVALIGALVVGITLFSGGVMTAAAEVLTSKGLKIAMTVVIVGLILWLTSIVLTARTTHGNGWSRKGEALHKVFTALMCLIVTMPAAEAVRYVAVTQDAFGSMFIKSNRAGNGSASNPWKNQDRVNFLLIGSDAGPDRTGIRTDSLMVVSVDTRTGDTTLISIPRNLQNVPFPKSNPLHEIYPDGFKCPEVGKCIMDAVWGEAAVEHKDLFKGDEYPGLTTTRDVVSEIVGMPLDYSTVINLQGFRDLVDAMGGVDMTIPKGGLAIGGRIVGGQVVPGSITGRLPEGRHHLNGQQALWYARSRVETGDSDRMRRQRCMVNAMVSQSNPVSLVQRFPDIMKVAKQNILLDLPQDALPALAQLAEKMQKGEMKSVNLAYPVISDTNPDFAKIRQLVQKGLERPKPTAKPKPKTSPSSSTTTPSTSTTTQEDAVSDTKGSC